MPEKKRTLGFKEAYAIGLGTMIAAGIFSLSGKAVASIGSTSILSFVIAAVVAGVTAAAYSEFASIYSESGGGYLFSSRTFQNNYLIFAEGIMLFFGYTATTAFYLATAGEWIHKFIFAGLPPWASGIAIAILLGVLNATGTEESGTFQVVVSGLKVLVLIIFVAGVFVYKPPGEAVSTFITEIYIPTDSIGVSEWLSNVMEIASLAFITFFGFSAIAASAGEIKNAKRTVPLSIGASIITVTILYTLVIFAMVNSPVDPQILAEQGETAMGEVAAAYLGTPGKWLIVAGAIFSMASASNASILAASRIGYLMGREGKAFRRLQRVSRKYGTPVWSILIVTIFISTFIFLFMGLFHGDNALLSIKLGLTPLTGFATTNLLIPLTIVNISLVYSRKNIDVKRPVKLPLVPLTPTIGILANLYLVSTLPTLGAISGLVGTLVFILIYVIWGGYKDMSRVIEELDTNTTEEFDIESEYTILLPVRSPQGVSDRLKSAHRLCKSKSDNYQIAILCDELVQGQVPTDQADPSSLLSKISRVEDIVEDSSVQTKDTVVLGHLTKNVALDIVQTARDTEANLIMMGYPQQSKQIAQSVKTNAPCDIAFTRGLEPNSFDNLTVGVGSGPHHNKMLSTISDLAKNGSNVYLTSVTTEDVNPESEEEMSRQKLSDIEVKHKNIESDSIAEGLLTVATETDSLLLIGATRDSVLKQKVFGSTPDEVAQLAYDTDTPIVIYGQKDNFSTKIESIIITAVRTLSGKL
jgi:amino acid transporter